MKPAVSPWSRFQRYFKVLFRQCLENREYLYFWLLATILDIAAVQSAHPLSLALIALINLAVGALAIGSLVRPVDRAFETIGLDFSKGYGSPDWIVRGKYPAKQDAIRVRSAGYAEEDFARHVPQIASRLNQPILGLRKVSPDVPEIEVLLKRGLLPDSLTFASLDLTTLASGEFYVGQSAQGIERLSLNKMTHMLVAGQTGSGKTQFLRQFMATVLTHTRGAHLCLIDMKGGIDFQAFRDTPGFELATQYDDAEILLEQVVAIYEKRRDLILARRKSHWSEFLQSDLEADESLKGVPIGPIVVVVDELAELSKKATAKAAKSELQEKLATLARLSRFTGIHLVLGTQRPDKSTIDMQSKDNLPTRVCFSVPSVTASNLVLGDMSASTLGSRPGRGIFQLSGSKVIQAPLVTNSDLERLLTVHREKRSRKGDARGIIQRVATSTVQAKEVRLK